MGESQAMGGKPGMGLNSAPNDNPLTGRRELNKQDKLQRLRAAAQTLFIRKGFDETTVREIAREAGVGLGTLFSYSLNKRDLLFLIGNEGLQLVADLAAQSISPNRSLKWNLRAIFAPHYAFFMREGSLGRDVLREMTFYEQGPQAQHFRAIRVDVLATIRQALQFAVSKGEIATKRPLKEEAWVIFAIYQVELRNWLSGEEPDLEDGLARLQKSLQICIRGLG